MRPLDPDDDETTVEILSEDTIQLNPPKVSYFFAFLNNFLYCLISILEMCFESPKAAVIGNVLVCHPNATKSLDSCA